MQIFIIREVGVYSKLQWTGQRAQYERSFVYSVNCTVGIKYVHYNHTFTISRFSHKRDNNKLQGMINSSL